MPDATPIKLNSGAIAARITVVDDTLRDLERRATGLSLDAVGGDAAAIAELTKIDREIARAKASRVALERAQTQAATNEQAELAAIEAAKRAKHHEVARQYRTQPVR